MKAWQENLLQALQPQGDRAMSDKKSITYILKIANLPAEE